MANQLVIKDILIILSLMTLSTYSEVRFCFVGETLTEYDTMKEKCCGNVVHEYKSSDVECCGNVTYNSNSEICCQETVYPRVVNNTRFDCCAGLLYRSDQRKICCNHTLHTTSNSRGQMCCGDRLIDGLKNGCCMSEVYDEETHYCFEKQTVLPYGFAKCGGTTYNIDHHICCSGQLHNRSLDMTSCCGNQTYNTKFNICCHTSKDPHIAPRNGHNCCGSSYYNVKTQTCCNFQVMDARPTESCCGGALFDKTFQDCCAGVIYNTSTSKCCGRSVIPAHGTCCGNKELDVENEVCCNNRFPLKKSHRSHDACCLNTELKNTGKSYNKNLDVCSEGNPPDITNSAYKTCGRMGYNEFNDLCCLNELYVNGRIDGKECCLPGDQAYNTDTEICCDGTIYDKSSRKSCVPDEDPILEPFPLISDKKMFTYGICTLCNENWKNEDFREAIENEDINTCLKSALKVEVLRVSHNKRRGKILQTRLYLKVQKNLYSPRGFPKRREKIDILLPCTCRNIYSSDVLLFVTNIDMRKSQLRLGDSDVLVPYFPRLRKAVKQRHGLCDKRTKTTFIKSINDIQDYIDYQLKKTFS